MQGIFGILAAVVGFYSLLIFIRIIISWFAGSVNGRPVEILSGITDPYLEWWRQNVRIRIVFFDFSAIAAIAFLSLVQRFLYILSGFEKITLGKILAMVLLSVWSVVSFFIGFCLIIIIIRLIGYMTNCNIYSNFWRVIDSISQALLYRINRMIFGRRIIGYFRGIITSLLLLAAIWIGGRYAVSYLAKLLLEMPL